MQFKLGGSSFAQVLNKMGNEVPTIKDAAYFQKHFQYYYRNLLKTGKIAAGHDIGSGGLITTLLEMSFAEVNLGAEYDLTGLNEADTVKALFAENIAIVIQADASVEAELAKHNVAFTKIGQPKEGAVITIKNGDTNLTFDIAETRDTWFKTSYLLRPETKWKSKSAGAF